MAQITNDQATAWWVVFVTLTGELFSVGSELANPLPPELTAVSIPSQLDQNPLLKWNPITKVFA